MNSSRTISSVTRESLIKAFTISGKPFLLCYQKIGQSKERWLDAQITLQQMMSEETVTVVEDNETMIVYQYHGKLTDNIPLIHIKTTKGTTPLRCRLIVYHDGNCKKYNAPKQIHNNITFIPIAESVCVDLYSWLVIEGFTGINKIEIIYYE